jgi:hypothetical protein
MRWEEKHEWCVKILKKLLVALFEKYYPAGRDLEGSGSTWHFPAEIEENCEKPQSE